MKNYLKHVTHQATLTKPAVELAWLYRAMLSLALLCGGLFYVLYRTESLHWYLLQVQVPSSAVNTIRTVLLPNLPSVVLHSFPSFISGLSALLFIASVKPAGRTAWCIALLSSILTMLMFEIFLGTFDWLDIAAMLMGSLAGIHLISKVNRLPTAQTKTNTTTDTALLNIHGSSSAVFSGTLVPATAAVVFSSLLAVGSTFSDSYGYGECARYSEEGYCEEYKSSAQPVYMSYAKLRNSVALEEPRSPDRIGRLYLYGDYVFLNEVNEGIHIIDNTNQLSPRNVAFIRIPGNTEIAVRSNYLYADSYIDLITLDISNPQNLVVIGREESIFPYDEYQNIPQNISLSSANINRSQGVVISYRLD